MAKKGLENFTDKVAKDLIKKQSIRDEQRKIREEYLENKYKEASDLTNDIEVYIESLNNIININPNVISIEEFIKRDIQDVPKARFHLFTHLFLAKNKQESYSA